MVETGRSHYWLIPIDPGCLSCGQGAARLQDAVECCVVGAGYRLALAVWLTFFVQYGNGLEMRKGFPIPLLFFHPDDKTWTNTDLPVPLLYASIAADFLTGLAAPFIPYKIGEFMKQVKAELK